MIKILKRFSRRYIQPRSINPDEQRREYVFNSIIGLFTLSAFVASVVSSMTHIFAMGGQRLDSVIQTIGFLLLMMGLWWLSRRGRYKFSASVFVGILLAAALQLALTWSIELPMEQLLSVLIIVVVGLVISSRAVIVVTAIISFATLILGYFASGGMDTSWLTTRPEPSDAIGIVVVYCIVGGVAWLANREIDRLLQRAWRSEKALAKERDQLEVTVARRTRELEQTQLARDLETQRFAEFGRVSATLVHDLASPLTAISLNLELVGDTANAKLISQAMAGMHHIQSYISAARKQLQGESRSVTFDAEQAIREVVDLLSHQARKHKIAILLEGSEMVHIFGDQAAFHRVMANLLLNALQAYEQSRSTRRIIKVELHRESKQKLAIVVQDFGVGIQIQDLPHIFDEFYTTKGRRSHRGLGLGLANTRRVVEQDFKGTIAVASRPGKGTTFTLLLPISKNARVAKNSQKVVT